jgi:hypothetical protein
MKMKKLQEYLDSYPLEAPIGDKGSMLSITTGLLFSSTVKASRARQWIEESYKKSGKLAGKFDELKAKLGFNAVDDQVQERLDYEARLKREDNTEEAHEDNFFGTLALTGGTMLLVCTILYYCLAGPSVAVFISLALGVTGIGCGLYLLRSSVKLSAMHKGSAIASKKHKGIISNR